MFMLLDVKCLEFMYNIYIIYQHFNVDDDSYF